jgi:glycosyltransferase involved in cell wall biosynthesis
VDGITLHKAHPLSGGVPVLRFFHPRMTGLWSALRRADADVYYLSCASMQLGMAAAFTRLHSRRLVFRLASDTDCEPDRLLIRHARDRWLYEWGLRRADVVLAQSEHQARRLKSNYGLDSRLAAMLVDPAQQVRTFDARDIDVLWVSNLRPLKRPELALELARRLPGLRVHLVGGPLPGHEDLYAQIQAQAQALPHVRFHGRVPYHDVNALYERARVFVNTSEIEGFPNAYLQAWRRGTPSVAFFDPDGIVRTHGLGRSAASLEDLVEGTRVLATDTQAWAGAHARCLRFMDERYGEDRVLEPYVEALLGPMNGVRA